MWLGGRAQQLVAQRGPLVSWLRSEVAAALNVSVVMKRGYICVRQILIQVWKIDFQVEMRQVF